jgi:hypothetical protein
MVFWTSNGAFLNGQITGENGELDNLLALIAGRQVNSIK